MPTNFIKKLHNTTGQSTASLESKWNKAKHIAAPELSKQHITDPSRKYAYMTKIFENEIHHKPKK